MSILNFTEFWTYVLNERIECVPNLRGSDSYLVAVVTEGFVLVAVARLAPSHAFKVPEPVGALVTEGTDHSRPAGAVSCLLVAPAGASHRAESDLRPSRIARALWR